MSYLNRLCIVIAMLFLLCLSCEDLPQLQPGEFVTIPGAEKLSPGDDVMVYFYPDKEGATRFYMYIGREYDQITRIHLPIERDRELLKTTFNVPGDAIGFKSYVEYPDKSIKEYPSETFVLYDKNGKAIAGSRLWYTEYAKQYFNEEQVDSVFRLEIGENPGELMLYKTRWRWMSRTDTTELTGAEMEIVRDKARENEQGLAVLAWVYAYKGEIDSATTFLERYFERAGEPAWAPVVARLIYHVTNYSDSMDERTWSLISRTARMYPLSKLGEDYVNRVMWRKREERIPDSLAEWILDERVKNDPGEYNLMANYRAMVLKDTSLAAEAAEHYIQSVKAGEIDTSWTREGFLLARMYKMVSQDLLKKGKFSDALSNAEEAIEVNDDDNYRGEFVVQAARCAQAAENPEKMNEYIILAVAYGTFDDLDSLMREFYPNVEPEEQLQKLFREAAGKCEPAPQAIIVSSSGESYVVGGDYLLVLDFWGPGCGPCIQEMPILSSFAGDYMDRPDIKLLAVTNTPDDYFKKRPMNFENWVMCNGQQEVFEAFKVTAIPHFFIIDTQGRIRFSQIGAPLIVKSASKVLDMLIVETYSSQTDDLISEYDTITVPDNE
ncbi:redoxin domain-containing protein [bacterium]|nr:redoxin domain-containing protein [bacterium]